MKNIFFTLALITFIMGQTQAQNTDLQSIENTINHYFNGMIKHDADSFKKAFHPTAMMRWNEKDYMEVNAVEALSQYVNTNAPAKTRTKIVSVNVIGDAANAVLELEYEAFYFVDFMHLMKVDKEWKIVSKTYTTVKKDF